MANRTIVRLLDTHCWDLACCTSPGGSQGNRPVSALGDFVPPEATFASRSLEHLQSRLSRRRILGIERSAFSFPFIRSIGRYL
jgi:hypothetical protein